MSGSMHPAELLDDDDDPTRPDAPTPKSLSLVAVAVKNCDALIAWGTRRRDAVGGDIAKHAKRTRANLCSWDVEKFEPSREVAERVLGEMRQLEEQAAAVGYRSGVVLGGLR